MYTLSEVISIFIVPWPRIGVAVLILERMRNPVRQAFSYWIRHMFSYFIESQWKHAVSRMKILPYGIPHPLNTELTDSRKAGILIRDMACFRCDAMKYDQIRGKQRCHYTSYTVGGYQNMAYNIRQNAWIEMKKKISCKSFQKSEWSYDNERKTSPTNHAQFIWLKLWIKEKNGVHKVTIILTSRNTCRVTIHFCMRSSVVWN